MWGLIFKATHFLPTHPILGYWLEFFTPNLLKSNKILKIDFRFFIMVLKEAKNWKCWNMKGLYNWAKMRTFFVLGHGPWGFAYIHMVVELILKCRTIWKNLMIDEFYIEVKSKFSHSSTLVHSLVVITTPSPANSSNQPFHIINTAEPFITV